MELAKEINDSYSRFVIIFLLIDENKAKEQKTNAPTYLELVDRTAREGTIPEADVRVLVDWREFEVMRNNLTPIAMSSFVRLTL